MKTCSVGGCEKTAHARTYCITHYSRWRTGRDLTVPYRLQDRDDDVAAGRSKTEVANDNGITRTAVYLIVKGQNWSHLQQRSA